jgi:pimeloyl-ACP methyl ester carboxylesterase
MRRFLLHIASPTLALLLTQVASAQDPKPGDVGYIEATAVAQISAAHFGSSPFSPPEENDQTFVVDQDSGLDTGCTFRSGGPLVFTIEIDRVIGDKSKLIANGLIGEYAALSMPAYDVDFDANISGINPERDQVFFNGNLVPTEFLTGSNNVWKLNEFNIPIEWVNFPVEPGKGGTPTPADNIIQIVIDTANVGSGEYWCTAIDWAAISIDVARPVVMAHGIFSIGGVWNPIWVSNLQGLGLPYSNDLNMGNLDSISNNAAKIASEIAIRKDQWGVDKVVLVGHSKGGLDSREFVESNPDVEQVIQIGTPNAGSPLADAIQGGLLRAGVLPAVVVNGLVAAFSGPAGIQLTTPYMAGYNLFHGFNPNVRYTAMAGAYDPDCPLLNPFCRPIQRILLGISGSPGDTIVPVSSVHSLSFTHNRIFPSSGTNMDATHACVLGFTSCQLESQRIFDQLSDRVSAFGTTQSARLLQFIPSLLATASTFDSIQMGQSVDLSLPIDEQTETFFSLSYPSGDLDLILISPSGQVINPVVAADDPDMGHETGELFAGLIETYVVGQPEIGVWTLQVSAPSVVEPNGEVGFFVTAWLADPAITLKGELVDTNIRSGDSLTLLATVLEGGAPLSDAMVTAIISLPDGTTRELSLVDDGITPDDTAGDGVYTANLTDTTQSGNYPISFVAERSNSPGEPDFSRQAFAVATVSRSSSIFAGTFHDFGIDTDGDGFFNQLIVEADLDITDVADYRIFGILEDATGNVHQANVVQSLSDGLITLSLSFDGESIFQNGVDGPYTLSIIRLAEEEGLALMPVAELADAHETAAYSFEEFQHAPIVLTGDGTSNGRDVDGNGLFDILDVTIDVRVDNPGYYNWSARLVDADGTEIGFTSARGFFSSGINSMSFAFNGEPIGENAVDGPYYVNNLLIYGANTSLVSLRAFTTDTFLASQFEGFVGDTTPPNLEVTLEPNVLWPPNHRLVEVQANISVTDDTDPQPEVTLVSIVSSEPDDGLGDGDTLNDIQEADFGVDDRVIYLRAERSGTGADRIYTVTYRATDDSGNQMETSETVIVPHDFGKIK